MLSTHSTELRNSFEIEGTIGRLAQRYDKIATVKDEMYGSGEHEVSLNAENLGNGIYICKITAGVYSEIIKLILIR